MIMPLIKVFGTSRILNEGVKLAGEESEKLCHHIILSARNKVGNFLEIKDGSVSEKSECKIIVKIWNELYKSYPGLEFGDYYFESDNFHGIISVNSGLNTDPRKAVQKAVGELKSRTTLLLNRYHNIYGSVFWENGYREIAFKDNGKLGNLMDYFWKHPA